MHMGQVNYTLTLLSEHKNPYSSVGALSKIGTEKSEA